MQRTAGNQAVARLVGDRQDAAGAGGHGSGGGGPPAAKAAPDAAPAAPASQAAPPAPAAPAVDAISGAGGAPAPPAATAAPGGAAGPAPAGGAAAPGGTALPAPLAALATVKVVDAPGLLQVASAGVSLLGNQANVRAYEKNQLKGPVPTGLPAGAEPPAPQEPTIPDPGRVAPAGDADSSADIAGATQRGTAQVEAGRAAAERAADADTGVDALVPTQARGEIPSLGLGFVYPRAGPAPIPTTPEPEVVKELEGAFGQQGRETAVRELSGGAALLQQHDQAVDKQHADAAGELATENERAKLEQLAAREEARRGVEIDKARWRRENAAAIAEFQREAAAEQAAAQAEVARAKEEARNAEEAARNQPEEDDDEAWYERAWGAVKSGAKAVGGAIKGAVVKAYKFVKDRVTRFFSKVAELVSDGIAKIREIGGRIYRGIRDKIKAGLNKINEIAHRIGRWVADVVDRLGRFISGLVNGLVDFFMGLVNRIADFFRWAWNWAVKIKDIVVAIAKGGIQLLVELIRDPLAVLERAKGALLDLVKRTPQKIDEVYHQHIGPVLDGPAQVQAAPQAAGAGAALAREPDDGPVSEPQEKESNSDGVWRHLTVRGEYFLEHWWEVVKDAALEILVPFVAIYRHLPKAFDNFSEAWQEAKRGNWSRMTDSILDAVRELMAIFVTIVAQVSIVAFIIGSILGTPVVGFAVLEGIGLAVIAVDAALQITTIIKAATNLDDDDEDDDHKEKDFGRIADSSVALAVMLVLVLLGAVASKAASALVARFPALARAAEALKVKIRRKIGVKAPEGPTSLPSKMKPLEAKPPEATGYPVRDKLSADDQIAFDKFVADRTGKSDPHLAIDGKSVAEVEAMLKNQRVWVAKENAKVAENAKWQGDMLDPKMTNPPTRAPSAKGEVWERFNDPKNRNSPKEIEEAGRLSETMGMRIDLFGDAYPGIDGVASHGATRIPVQLKGLIASDGATDVVRVAADAFQDAAKTGFTGVEVYIEASHLSTAEVRAAFRGTPKKGVIIDGKIVRRVRIRTKDGIYEPAVPDPIKAPHPGPDVKDPSKDEDKVPAGAGAG